MFTTLTYDVRFLIWKTILDEARVIRIYMREVPVEEGGWVCYDEPPKLEPLCSITVPVLLHICTETRVLALAHYELTFGHANAPTLRLPGITHHLFSVKGIPYVTAYEGNEAEVAKYAPKIYFNFERDTAVFDQTLLPRRGAPESRRYMNSFSYGDHIAFQALQRIENLGLSLDSDSGLYSGSSIFSDLNRQVGSGSFQRLKKLYLDLGAVDLNLGREVDLIEFREGDDKTAQNFVETWKIAFKRENIPINGLGMEGLRITCKEGLTKQHQLRELLLKNGASPEEVLKCVWMKDMDRID